MTMTYFVKFIYDYKKSAKKIYDPEKYLIFILYRIHIRHVVTNTEASS